MTVTVVRTTPGGLDPHGAPLPSTETRHPLPGAFTAPRTSSDVAGREGIVVGLTLFCSDPDADLLHTDQVEVNGTLFDIDGGVGVWRNPLNPAVDGISCALKRGQG